LNNFRFIPITENITTIESTAEQWTNGKMNPDGWTLRINTIPNFECSKPISESEIVPTLSSPLPSIENEENETMWSAIPIKDWNIPDESAPPSPPRRQNPIKQEHASMHWSFCQLPNCKFHRGKNSWSY